MILITNNYFTPCYYLNNNHCGDDVTVPWATHDTEVCQPITTVLEYREMYEMDPKIDVNHFRGKINVFFLTRKKPLD